MEDYSEEEEDIQEEPFQLAPDWYDNPLDYLRNRVQSRDRIFFSNPILYDSWHQFRYAQLQIRFPDGLPPTEENLNGMLDYMAYYLLEVKGFRVPTTAGMGGLFVRYIIGNSNQTNLV